MALQEKLRSGHVRIPIVFLTGHGDVRTAVKAMRHGAVNFLAKPFEKKDLLESVEQAIEEDKLRRAKSSRYDQVRELISQLSDREQEVMDLVVAGYVNKQIALELNVTRSTVEFHRANVMRKMQADSVAALVEMALLYRENGEGDQRSDRSE